MTEPQLRKMTALAPGASTSNPILDFVLTILLPFLTSPTTLALVFNAILQTVKRDQSKAVARQIELTMFQTLGNMNPSDPSFIWPPKPSK